MNFYEYEVFSYFGESVSDSTLISFLDLMKKHLLVTKTVSYLKKKKGLISSAVVLLLSSVLA